MRPELNACGRTAITLHRGRSCGTGYHMRHYAQGWSGACLQYCHGHFELPTRIALLHSSEY
eukprot:3969829-Prymnesium_polylepis.1